MATPVRCDLGNQETGSIHETLSSFTPETSSQRDQMSPQERHTGNDQLAAGNGGRSNRCDPVQLDDQPKVHELTIVASQLEERTLQS